MLQPLCASAAEIAAMIPCRSGHDTSRRMTSDGTMLRYGYRGRASTGLSLIVAFRVVVDRGVRQDDGVSSYPLDTLDDAGLSWSFFDEKARDIVPGQIDGWDAVIVGGANVTADSVECERPPLVIARLGAGYDNLAVDACTER